VKKLHRWGAKTNMLAEIKFLKKTRNKSHKLLNYDVFWLAYILRKHG
jgi:hypothetical protein